MRINIQLISLEYSFLYGIFFYFMLLLNKKYLNNKYAFIYNLLFIIDNVLLYFIILRYINNGIFHIYFLFTIVLGFSLVYYVDKKKRI